MPDLTLPPRFATCVTWAYGRGMIANRRGKVDHPHTQSADADAAASHSSTRRS